MNSATELLPTYEQAVAAAELLLANLGEHMPRSCFATELEAAGDPELFRSLTAFSARLRHVAELLEMMLAGAVDVAGVQRRDRSASSRMWVSHEHGLTKAAANELVRADVARRRHPAIEAAVAEGSLTVAQVAAFASIIPDRFRGELLEAAIALVDQAMPTLLTKAATLSIDDFRRLCIAARERLDTDGREPSRKNDPAAPSEVRLSQLMNGRWALNGDLSGGDGAILATILEDARARDVREQADREQTDREPTELASTTDTADTADNAGTASPSPERRLSVRQAEALMRLVADGSGATKPGRAAVYLHVDLDGLLGRHSLTEELLGGGVSAWTESGLDVSENTLWEWLGGADITPIFSSGGQPLSYGRTRRIAPDILRRALAYRDRGCRAEGCDAPPVWTQAHHLRRWADGGRTDPDNMACKCGPQHRLEHADRVESIGTEHRVPCFRDRVVAQHRERRRRVIIAAHAGHRRRTRRCEDVGDVGDFGDGRPLAAALSVVRRTE